LMQLQDKIDQMSIAKRPTKVVLKAEMCDEFVQQVTNTSMPPSMVTEIEKMRQQQ
jgi:hypothetical protein